MLQHLGAIPGKTIFARAEYMAKWYQWQHLTLITSKQEQLTSAKEQNR